VEYDAQILIQPEFMKKSVVFDSINLTQKQAECFMYEIFSVLIVWSS
jgi:hypothetical protein